MRDPLARPLRGRELGEAVLRQIERNPESHDQGQVMDRCGSVGCIAGWAVVLGMPLEYASGQVHIWGRSHELAPRLLGLPEAEFYGAVYDVEDEELAKANLRRLLDRSHPRQPEPITVDEVVRTLATAGAR